jgi:hypothetical protein
VTDRPTVCTITTLAQPPPSVRTGSRLFVEIEADYDADFIAALKAAIPSADRAYDPDTTRWYTQPRHLETVMARALHRYDRIWLVTDHGRRREELRTGATATQMELIP